MKRNELLVNYCQRCGAKIGSFDCCQSSTNKSLRIPDNSHAFHHGVDRDGNAGVFEDFETSIGE